jgi:hypothetical protein
MYLRLVLNEADNAADAPKFGGLSPPVISAYDYVIETAEVVAVKFREQAQLKPPR